MKRWPRRLGITLIVAVDLLVFASSAALALGAGSHPRLAIELLRMAEADRRARLAQIEAGRPGAGELMPGSSQERAYERVTELDLRHQRRLEAIVDQIGWPHEGLVGGAAAHAAWLLTQHANLGFQVKALAQMREHADEVRPEDLAFLEDRVRMRQGRQQLYGTQYRCAGGRRTRYPVEDPELLEQRRRAVGLSSVAQNERRLERLYGPC